MLRKVVLAILAGLLYWLLSSYMMTALIPPEVIERNFRILVWSYYVMPFLFGCVLILIIKEKMYFGGIIYSAMIIAVRYAITLLEAIVRYPVSGPPFESTLWLFKSVGVYSMIFSIIGGVLGVFLTREIFFKKRS